MNKQTMTKPTRQELERDLKETERTMIAYLILALGFFMVLIIVIITSNIQRDNLQSQLTELKQNCNLNQSYNLNVICKGNGIYSSGNFTFNDYDLYQKMLKIFDVPYCEVLK